MAGVTPVGGGGGGKGPGQGESFPVKLVPGAEPDKTCKEWWN